MFELTDLADMIQALLGSGWDRLEAEATKEFIDSSLRNCGFGFESIKFIATPPSGPVAASILGNNPMLFGATSDSYRSIGMFGFLSGFGSSYAGTPEDAIMELFMSGGNPPETIDLNFLVAVTFTYEPYPINTRTLSVISINPTTFAFDNAYTVEDRYFLVPPPEPVVYPPVPPILEETLLAIMKEYNGGPAETSLAVKKLNTISGFDDSFSQEIMFDDVTFDGTAGVSYNDVLFVPTSLTSQYNAFNVYAFNASLETGLTNPVMLPVSEVADSKKLGMIGSNLITYAKFFNADGELKAFSYNGVDTFTQVGNTGTVSLGVDEAVNVFDDNLLVIGSDIFLLWRELANDPILTPVNFDGTDFTTRRDQEVILGSSDLFRVMVVGGHLVVFRDAVWDVYSYSEAVGLTLAFSIPKSDFLPGAEESFVMGDLPSLDAVTGKLHYYMPIIGDLHVASIDFDAQTITLDVIKNEKYDSEEYAPTPRAMYNETGVYVAYDSDVGTATVNVVRVAGQYCETVDSTPTDRSYYVQLLINPAA